VNRIVRDGIRCKAELRGSDQYRCIHGWRNNLKTVGRDFMKLHKFKRFTRICRYVAILVKTGQKQSHWLMIRKIFIAPKNVRIQNSKQNERFFYVLLTVQLITILVNNQLDAQFFFLKFVYSNSLYVSSNHVLITRESIVSIRLWFWCVLDRASFW